MTGDVLAYGDDRPPRRSPRRLAVVAVAVAVVAGGVAIAQTRGTHPRRTAGWTAYPTPSPSGPDVVEPPDPFDGALTVRRPADGSVAPLLLGDGVPGFLVNQRPGWTAVAAAGGPLYAPVLVGWCAPQRTFQDATATYGYRADGTSLGAGTLLATASVREHPGDPTRLDIAPEFGRGLDPEGPPQRVTRCPVPLTYPLLPERTTDVQSTRGAHLVIRGRYVVTTETVAFCAAVKPAGCADQGWERYAPASDQTLPPGDLAGSYTWEGDFLVQANSSDGTLSVIRLPGARLTRRDGVGVAVRVGLPHGTFRRGGVLHLHLNPVEAPGPSGLTVDDSPPGTPEDRGGVFPYVVHDLRGGLRDYVVRPDVEVILGRGITGLGHPRATPDTLSRFVTEHPDTPLWLVLDARGRVLRVVAEADIVYPVLSSDPGPVLTP